VPRARRLLCVRTSLPGGNLSTGRSHLCHAAQVPLNGSADEIADAYWSTLNDDNKAGRAIRCLTFGRSLGRSEKGGVGGWASSAR
jgi:hypothetical protein